MSGCGAGSAPIAVTQSGNLVGAHDVEARAAAGFARRHAEYGLDLGLHPLHVVSGRLLEGVIPIVTRLPGVVALMYAVMARSTRIQERTATVAVTSGVWLLPWLR
jgi:hypothetical protein